MSWSLTLHPCPRRAASIPNCASNRSPTFSTRSSCAIPHSRYIAPNIRSDVPSAELEVKTDRRTQHQRTYAPPHTSIGLHASQQISPSFQRLPSARHQQPFLAHHDLTPTRLLASSHRHGLSDAPRYWLYAPLYIICPPSRSPVFLPYVRSGHSPLKRPRDTICSRATTVDGARRLGCHSRASCRAVSGCGRQLTAVPAVLTGRLRSEPRLSTMALAPRQ